MGRWIIVSRARFYREKTGRGHSFRYAGPTSFGFSEQPAARLTRSRRGHRRSGRSRCRQNGWSSAASMVEISEEMIDREKADDQQRVASLGDFMGNLGPGAWAWDSGVGFGLRRPVGGRSDPILTAFRTRTSQTICPKDIVRLARPQSGLSLPQGSGSIWSARMRAATLSYRPNASFMHGMPTDKIRSAAARLGNSLTRPQHISQSLGSSNTGPRRARLPLPYRRSPAPSAAQRVQPSAYLASRAPCDQVSLHITYCCVASGSPPLGLRAWLSCGSCGIGEDHLIKLAKRRPPPDRRNRQ